MLASFTAPGAQMLSTVVRDLSQAVYPFNSTHQQAIEEFFGDATLRTLAPDEVQRLGQLDLFFVAFSNRSGSTLLTELMHQVGLPIPSRAEVFNAEEVLLAAENGEVRSFTDYFLGRVEGWSGNGQVGFKIGARQLFWLTRTGLLDHCNSIRLVNSRRADRLAQAVSLYIARQTGVWRSKRGEESASPPPVQYSREGLVQALHNISITEHLFEYYAQLHGVPCLDVEYESLLADPEEQLARVVEFLGFAAADLSRLDMDAVSISQQRGAENEQLRGQFERELRSAGG